MCTYDIYICISKYICKCMHVHILIYIYIFAYICTCLHMRIYTYILTYKADSRDFSTKNISKKYLLSQLTRADSRDFFEIFYFLYIHISALVSWHIYNIYICTYIYIHILMYALSYTYIRVCTLTRADTKFCVGIWDRAEDRTFGKGKLKIIS